MQGIWHVCVHIPVGLYLAPRKAKKKKKRKKQDIHNSGYLPTLQGGSSIVQVIGSAKCF